MQHTTPTETRSVRADCGHEVEDAALVVLTGHETSCPACAPEQSLATAVEARAIAAERQRDDVHQLAHERIGWLKSGIDNALFHLEAGRPEEARRTLIGTLRDHADAGRSGGAK